MIHPTIGWRRDEHRTHKHAHSSWILWSVSHVRSKTMHSLSCITSWLPYITLRYIDSRFFLPLEQSCTALLGCRLATRWQYNRVMLNGYGNENGKKKKEEKSKGLISKKKTTTSHVLHTFFFTFLCRCCCNVKLPSYTFYGENVVCAHKKHLLLVFLFAFFFSPPLIFTLLAAGISHFLTVAIKFLCFSSKDNRLLCFLSLVVALCRSFFRWASLACRLLSRFLCHSLSLHSKSTIMTINIKKKRNQKV